jgi:histidinol-phosphate aminotransferase
MKIEKLLGTDIFRVFPTKSNFVYVKTSLAEKIYNGLRKKGICIRYFGSAIRVNAGSRTENQEFLQTLKGVIS